jgi:hypothetical protein
MRNLIPAIANGCNSCLMPCARLVQMDGGVLRMQQHDFDEVVRRLLRALPDALPEKA